uniref:Uncharacterized protein n=1 Tax=Vespula pensylvanica TaxID=30213 RepID=A0A834PA02_VESPE|nr:hypothetical protein H0235_002442 [Vespula pensylvanica]
MTREATFGGPLNQSEATSSSKITVERRGSNVSIGGNAEDAQNDDASTMMTTTTVLAATTTTMTTTTTTTTMTTTTRTAFRIAFAIIQPRIYPGL